MMDKSRKPRDEPSQLLPVHQLFIDILESNVSEKQKQQQPIDAAIRANDNERAIELKRRRDELARNNAHAENLIGWYFANF
jgi:Flp pilus assembly protein TadD